MIRLDLKREPYWLDLAHGVRLHVRPITTAFVMAARVQAMKDAEDDAATRSAALLKNLAQLAVIDWEGVGDADGNPAPVSPEAIAALLDLWPIADAFERLYLGPALVLEQEKNA
ncbi:MAG: hypothetical protein ABTQ34_09740 [Bdellovibrionales bacterium]